MTVVIEGRLRFLGWNRPWNVERGDKVFDLSRDFWHVAERLKDAAASMPCRANHFVLQADPTSEYNCEYEEVGGGIVISRRSKFGWTNVRSYCETILANLNGQEIIASIEDGSFTVFANPHGPKVPTIKRKKSDRGNTISLEPGLETSRCGLGKGPQETCAFLGAGQTGFQCLKFDGSTTRTILHRLSEGTFRAKRIGDCAIDGYEE